MASDSPRPGSSGLVYPLPVTERAPGKVFAVFATSTIAAPPAIVLDAVLDYQSYGKWNHFVPHVTINSHPPHASSTGPQDTSRLQPGTKFTMSVFMNGFDFSGTVKPTAGRPTIVILNSLEEVKDSWKGFSLRWSPVQFPSWLLNSMRVQEFVETRDGQTLYSSRETFGGWLSWIVMWLYGGELPLRFNDWATGLKTYVELQQHGEQ